MKKKLDQQTRELIEILSLYWFAGALSGVFVNIFIWKQTASFTPVVVYNFFLFIALLIFYLASGYWLRKYSARTLVKLGIIILAIFYAFLVGLREKTLFWLIPMGLLHGMGNGFFWSGFNLHQYVHTMQSDRDFYFGVSTFWTSLTSVAGPLIGGAVVHLGNILISGSFLGYYLLFSLSVAVFSVALHKAKQLPRFSEISFHAPDLLGVVKRSTNFQKVLGQQALLGLRDVSTITIVSIFALTILFNEFNVGLYQSTVGLFFALSGFIAGRILTDQNRSKLTLISAISLTIAAIALAVEPNLTTLLVFGAGGVIGVCLDISLGTVYFSAIDEDERIWQEKYAYLLARDGVLGASRTMSYLTLWILFTLFKQEVIMRIWLVIACSLSLGIWLLIRKMRLRLQKDTRVV